MPFSYATTSTIGQAITSAIPTGIATLTGDVIQAAVQAGYLQPNVLRGPLASSVFTAPAAQALTSSSIPNSSIITGGSTPLFPALGHVSGVAYNPNPPPSIRSAAMTSAYASNPTVAGAVTPTTPYLDTLFSLSNAHKTVGKLLQNKLVDLGLLAAGGLTAAHFLGHRKGPHHDVNFRRRHRIRMFRHHRHRRK